MGCNSQWLSHNILNKIIGLAGLAYDLHTESLIFMENGVSPVRLVL